MSKSRRLMRSGIAVLAVSLTLAGVGGYRANAGQKKLSFSPLTLQNNWTGGPFSTRQPQIAKGGGLIHLQGAVQQAGAFNATITTLDEKYRPSANVYVPVDLCNANNGRILIRPTGQVSVDGGPGVANGTVQCFVSLEGVSYAAG